MFIPFRQLGQYEDVETGLYYNRFRYYNPETGLYLSQDPIRLAGGNPNFYAYVFNANSWVDLFGLDTIMVDPNDINYSQRTVSDVRVFDATKYSPIKVMEVDGQMVTYDNRRLLAAQNAGLGSLEVEIIDPHSPHPDSTTGKTWAQKFKERFNDARNKRAGGVVPDKGVKAKPTCK
jgi:RHS repeat-associated protein